MVQCPDSRRSWGVKKRVRAQTTVEFSLICLPFFAILFAIIDYAQIYFYDNALQNALRESCRFATAGRIIQATNPDGSAAYETNAGVVSPKAVNDGSGREASRNECARWWFLSNCSIVIPLTNITIISAPVVAGQPPLLVTNNGVLHLVATSTVTTNAGVVSTNTTTVAGPGNANDYIQITATYQVSTITPLMNYLGGYTHEGTSSYPLRVSAVVKNEPALLNFAHTSIYSDEP